MDLNLRDKVVLIAGSSLGIGKAIANGFAKEGATVVVTGRNETLVQSTVEEIGRKYGTEKILGHAGDLADTETTKIIISQCINIFGRLDVVIANIGSGRGRPGYDLTDEEWAKFLDINLMTNVKVVREAIPYLKKNGRGVIVFTSSIAGLETLGAPIAYEAAKSALIATSKSLSRELASYNIRVNCIAPGNILFPGSTWETKLNENKIDTLNYIASYVPQNRFGTPEEIADIVVFLSSDRASFITGACIVADGGQTKSF